MPAVGGAAVHEHTPALVHVRDSAGFAGAAPVGLARRRPRPMDADYVLTTVLDADDGLPYQALRMIREQVADAVRRVQRNAPLPEHKLVAVACYTAALNWQPSTRRPAGALNLHNESMCITPGLTRVVPFSQPMALGN